VTTAAREVFMATRLVVSACIVGTLAVFSFTGVAQASHAGAEADCGTAGTFTVKATNIPNGLQVPDPGVVTVFEEGGTLAIFEFSVNNELIFSVADTGRAHSVVAETTCSYTTGNGTPITVTGILTA
jgi:hypothetical protein